jgi:hypothetical protein
MLPVVLGVAAYLYHPAVPVTPEEYASLAAAGAVASARRRGEGVRVHGPRMIGVQLRQDRGDG